jgi:general secretion pathway protein K
MTTDRGIALLNALIMVAAISAVAAGLMLRAETSRGRVEHLLIGQQTALHLDAAEWLLSPVLRADWERNQQIDHLLEGWALEGFHADIDRAILAGQITDLQGRFNINSLSDAGDLDAAQSFERLLRSLGLPPGLGPEIAGFVQARGPVLVEEYAARDVPLRPPLEPLDTVQELRLVRGMTEAHLARLLPYVAALPPGTPLNVNTASGEVLGAVLPTATPANIARLIADRGRQPFVTRADFIARAETLLHPQVIVQAQLPAGGLAVSTDWFEARFDVTLDGRVQSRVLVVERSALTGAVEIRHRRAVTS